jgi:hypothetical protein
MKKPLSERRRKENQEIRELIDLRRTATRIAHEQVRELEEVTRELLFQKLGRNNPVDPNEDVEDDSQEELPEPHLKLASTSKQ